MSIIDDNSISERCIPDLDRRKFYDDGQNTHVRVISDHNGILDEGNSTHELLIAGETFEGEAVNILPYSIIYVTVYSDVASATDGLVIEQGHSTNGVGTIHWDSSDEFTIPAGKGKTFSIQPALQYLRVAYTNGLTDQTEFRLHVVLKKQVGLDSTHRIQDPIIDDDDARLVKSVLTGKNPSGNFINFDATAGGNFKMSLEELESGISVNSNSQLKVTPYNSSGSELGTPLTPYYINLPSTNFDSFGRFSVASPHKLYENGATHKIDTTRYHATSVVGGGTVTRNATKTQIELYTTTASGDKAIFSSRRNVQYNKANAQEIFIIYKANPIANRRERWGYFNTNNGIFFEHDGTNPRLVIRSNVSGSPVDTKIEQANWDDPLDGTGPSGLTIDWTKQTVYHFDFGWLSSRGVRFFIDIGGTFVLVKQWYISNSLDVPFMATATLPIRFEVENTDTVAQATTSSFTCYAVQSSGSSAQEGPVRSLSNGTTATSVSSTETVIGGIRLNSSWIGKGSIQPLKFFILPATGTDFVHYRIRYNPTLTSPTWSTPTNGIYDYLSGTMPTFTGGSILSEGTISLGNKNQVAAAQFRDVLNDVYIGNDIAGNADALVITMQTNTGTGSVFYSAEFKEFT